MSSSYGAINEDILTGGILANRTRQQLHRAALQIFTSDAPAKLTVSALANAAEMSRGTIYRHFSTTENLFNQIGEELSESMNNEIGELIKGISDPATRHATGIRLYVRQAHLDPLWGRFFVRYGLSATPIREVWQGPPKYDLLKGIATGRYSLAKEESDSAIGLMIGATLSAISLVLDGRKTWREAGSESAVLVLKAYGLSPVEATSISTSELPNF